MRDKLHKSRDNLKRALESLKKSLATPPTEDRDLAGIIHNFEFVYELTWKALQRVLQERGVAAPFPRVVFEESFKQKMISGNEIWKDIIESRNLTAHTYDPALAQQVFRDVRDRYLSVFIETFALIDKAIGD